MKKTVLLAFTAFAFATATFAQDKLISKDGSINFFSTTPAEDISSNNYSLTSTLDPGTGDVVFSVPMQGFEFEKSLMQQHFNSKKFLNTKKYPKGKFVGKITNLSDIDFSKDGKYDANVSGELSIHGVTNQINEKGTITVEGEKVTVDSKFKVTLADYEIAFKKGKPSTNIAKVVDVTVKSVFNR